jgi:all-trans-retinol dehydrogenase (NAD+)
MIERKRGHIVAVSSTSSFFAIPKACSYVATKFGVRGFMNALYLELCTDGHDEFVNLTTVAPSFMTTRKQLNDALNIMQYV